MSNCSCHRPVKHLEHGTNAVEGVLKRMHCRIVNPNEMQFVFMPWRGTIDAVFILERLQEGDHAKVACAFCGPRERSLQRTKESVGMDNEEKMNTSSFD